MADQIEWTDHTFNPWWGCARVSPGCANCYAERLSRRFGSVQWGHNNKRRVFGPKHWEQPIRCNRAAAKSGTRRRVFCASMADVFDVDGPQGERNRLWAMVEEAPNLDWQVLTKRPENAVSMLPDRWLSATPQNLWVGTSVESSAYLHRVDRIREIPARVRFLSIEPLLEPIDHIDLQGVGWVIVGGESGPGARPMDSSSVRKLRDKCLSDGIPFFFKQWGQLRNNPSPGDPTAKENGGYAKGGRQLEGVLWSQFPALGPTAT